MSESGGVLRANRSRGLWRWAAGGLAAGLLVGFVATLTYPETYNSRGSLRIVPSDIPERLMPAALALDVGSLRREMTQLLGEALGVHQSEVSKIEHQTDEGE